MKFVFIDTEFTGLHAFTTLVSIGLVTLEGETLYVCVNDYDHEQVTPWVKDNVLPKIDEAQCVSSREACEKIGEFLALYAQDDYVSLVSAGKMNDHLLLFQLWHAMYPEQKHFHFSNTPDFLYHDSHFDLHTLFLAAGIDPNEINREDFIDVQVVGAKHDALFDAKVVRECFLKLVRSGKLPHLMRFLPGLE